MANLAPDGRRSGNGCSPVFAALYFFFPDAPNLLERFLLIRKNRRERLRSQQARDGFNNMIPTALGHLIFLSLVLTTSAAFSQVQKIQIQGRLKIEAVLEAMGPERRITGRLTDEFDKPVMGTVRLGPSADTVDPGLPISPCVDATTEATALSTSTESGVISTTEAGEFCIRVAYQGTLWAFAYSPHLQSTPTIVVQDQLGLKAPQFLSTPEVFDLHLDQTSSIEVLASSRAGATDTKAALELALVCNHQVIILGEDIVQGSRLARFGLTARNSMAAGVCQLRATLSSTDMMSVSAYRELLIRDDVSLEIADVQTSRSTAQVTLRARSSTSPSGMIEAKGAEHFASSVPLSPASEANFAFELTENEQDLSFKYVSAIPALVAGTDAHLRLPSRGTGFNWGVLHALGLVLFLGWIAYQWMLPNRLREAPQPPLPARPAVQARKMTSGAIRGTVVDAHTQLPLLGVQVQLIQTTATGSPVIETTWTNGLGEFCLSQHFEGSSLVALVFTGQALMTLSTPVIAAEFDVTMTGRRRAVIEQLIAWAKLRGRPWDARPNPTVGHVISVAKTSRQAELQFWAEQVEKAGYGPTAPSEDQVRRLKNVNQDAGAVPLASGATTLTTKI